MSHDAKTQSILAFLESQAEAYPALAGELTQMSDLYTRKLWHQLTLSLQAVAATEGSAPLLQPLYDTFVSDFKHKLNKLALAQLQVAVAHQIVGEPWLFDCVFSERAVTDYRGVLGGDADLARAFNQSMRQSGLLKADAKLYTHAALTDADMDQILGAVKKAAQSL